jgi:hypothetical protein
MTADPGIVAAVDRAAAPLSRFADLIEAIPAGRDPQEVIKGFRNLHKDLSRIGSWRGRWRRCACRTCLPASAERVAGAAMVVAAAVLSAASTAQLGYASLPKLNMVLDDLNKGLTGFTNVIPARPMRCSPAPPLVFGRGPWHAARNAVQREASHGDARARYAGAGAYNPC